MQFSGTASQNPLAATDKTGLKNKFYPFIQFKHLYRFIEEVQ